MTDRTNEANQFEQGRGPIASPAPRVRQDLIRVGLVVAACLVLVVGAALARGASPSPRTDPGPGAAVGIEADDGDEDGLAGAFDDEDSDDDPGDHANKDGGGRFGPITIEAISGTRIDLATEDGWTRTIDITTETVIRRGDAAATAADLKVGDEVRIRQRRNADGTFTVVAIVVRVPRASGEVTGVSGNTITVKARGGATLTINVTDSTTYRLGPNPASKSDVKVGSRIAAVGERVAGGSFTANTIRIALAQLSGEVTAKTSDSITLRQRDGSSKTIHVGPGTTYKVRGLRAAPPRLADIAVGNHVQAAGILRADGSLDAIVVQVGKMKGPKPKPAASPGG